MGITKGRTEVAKGIVLVLRTHGIDVTEEVERRILACSDPVLLSQRLQRAVTVSDAIDVIAE